MDRTAEVSSRGLIAEFLRSGAPVSGKVPFSCLHARREHEPTKSLMDVLKASKWSKQVIKAKMGPHQKNEVDRKVLVRTQVEMEEGNAVGPLTEADQTLGSCLCTSQKVRP